jgi:hypothetical protein
MFVSQQDKQGSLDEQVLHPVAQAVQIVELDK